MQKRKRKNRNDHKNDGIFNCGGTCRDSYEILDRINNENLSPRRRRKVLRKYFKYLRRKKENQK